MNHQQTLSKLTEKFLNQSMKTIRLDFLNMQDDLENYLNQIKQKSYLTLSRPVGKEATKRYKKRLKHLSIFSSESHRLLQKKSLTELELCYLRLDEFLSATYRPYTFAQPFFLTHYHNALTQSYFNLKSLTGKPMSFKLPKQVPLIPFDGLSYTSHLLIQKDYTLKQLFSLIQMNLIQEKPTFKKDLMKLHHQRLNAFNNTLRTQGYMLTGQAVASSYEAYDITHYQIISKQDTKTCHRCKKQDQQIYLLASLKVGINYPPFHYRCRCLTLPIL